MNTTQKAVLLVGLMVLVGMFLYPPWMITLSGGEFYYGYAPLWHSPLREPETAFDFFTRAGSPSLPRSTREHINYSRLLLQWFLVSVGMGVLYKVFDAPRPKGPDSE